MQVGEAEDQHEEAGEEELQPDQATLQGQGLDRQLVEEEHPDAREAVAHACHEDLELLSLPGGHGSKVFGSG